MRQLASTDHMEVTVTVRLRSAILDRTEARDLVRGVGPREYDPRSLHSSESSSGLDDDCVVAGALNSLKTARPREKLPTSQLDATP